MIAKYKDKVIKFESGKRVMDILKEDLKELFKDFKIHNLEEKKMDRYEHPKILWEFCVEKNK